MFQLKCKGCKKEFTCNVEDVDYCTWCATVNYDVSTITGNPVGAILFDKESTQYELMEAFKKLAIESKRCGEEEFYDMLHNYLVSETDLLCK